MKIFLYRVFVVLCWVVLYAIIITQYFSDEDIEPTPSIYHEVMAQVQAANKEYIDPCGSVSLW